ncbi:MAG: hypothetical protein NTZ34_08015 [Chloroflexi bacterium]|nr:hypothetical protein [Chloroflexota bacterium]
MTPSIVDLAHIVTGLSSADQRMFERIFSVDIVRGNLKLPSPMAPWVKAQFGSLDRVTSQKIVKITNLVTLESSVYNPLRALRPHNFSHRAEKHAANADEEVDRFAVPLDCTAEDLFGRVQGKHCITAGNIARYEQHHCVVVFNKADPMDFGCSEVADYIETGWKWAQRAHDFDPLARYCLFLWNCNNRAGASIRHGHAQVILGRGSHYVKIESLRKSALLYKEKYGPNYFDDLFAVHEALGLGWKSGDTRIMVYLSALKQNEVMILSPGLTPSLTDNIYRVLSCFRDKLDVKSSNLGIAFPPLGDSAGWEGFPVISRMVDRGNTNDISSDIGAMEFYGANVVNSDPYETAGVLR